MCSGLSKRPWTLFVSFYRFSFSIQNATMPQLALSGIDVQVKALKTNFLFIVINGHSVV